tara:strand:- start:13737 stop:14060 length:324 start_codon:yes stop_codon:yes gene_type:complete
VEVKLIELRDHGTCIPLLCIKPYATTVPVEMLCARRYGYDNNPSIIVTNYENPSRGARNDPFEWNDRTYYNAHAHIELHWESLKTGDLVDVRVILGETDKPCQSEFL